MKVLNLVLAAMFIVFAFLQVNDPDPVLWILIYGLMACSCILAAFRFIIPRYWIVVAVIFFAYSFVYLDGVGQWLKSDEKHVLFSEIAKMRYLWVEETREFLGLMICTLILVMHLFQARALRRRYGVR